MNQSESQNDIEFDVWRFHKGTSDIDTFIESV